MKTLLSALLLATPALAVAQTVPAPTPVPTVAPATTARSGGLLGGGLPQVGTIGAGNAAGLLGYCVRNKLLGATGGQTGAAGVLGRLTGQKDVTTLPGYQAGQTGQVQAANGQTLSIDPLRGQIKTQLCNLILNRARSFL